MSSVFVKKTPQSAHREAFAQREEMIERGGRAGGRMERGWTEKTRLASTPFLLAGLTD